MESKYAQLGAKCEVPAVNHLPPHRFIALNIAAGRGRYEASPAEDAKND